MIKRILGSLAMAGVLCLVGWSRPAHADILFNNTRVAATNFDSVVVPLYDSFSTGANGVVLTSVSLMLEASNPTDGGSVVASLFSDTSGSPNVRLRILGNIADSRLSAAPSILQLAGFAPVALASTTRYWIRLAPSGSPATSAAWLYDNTTTGVGVKAEYSYNATNITGPTPNISGSSVYLMEVTAVPEPDAVAILLLGLFATGIVSRRRKTS